MMKTRFDTCNMLRLAGVLVCLGSGLPAVRAAESDEASNQLTARTGLEPFEYMEAPAPMPNYVAGARWGTEATHITTMQKPLSPAESMPHLVTFPEFEVTFFAAEPQITKPIWMTWDERGRLWIAETVDYPNRMQPEGQGRDRIKICEDTDGDGRADKFTVFADTLSVVTSFVFANGGVIAIDSGKTEFFQDTNGDDKADVRKLLFAGWGTRDTHATASNLRWGFDNWIWGVVGYSGFEGEVGGKQLRFGQGIFRFKPDGSELEFIRSSNNNTWGLGFSEEGIVFGSTANGNASMYLAIPNRYYEAVRGWSASRLETIADSQRFYPITEKVRQVDWHNQYTAGAGSALYTARNFPRDYWNRVQFVTEPTGHLIGKFHLEANGADFVAHNGRNFAASDDEWTSPICAEVGPDGALWVIDWYNYIIQHNPTPIGFQNGRGNAYETPLRDKSHGRVYRIAWKDARPAPSLNLAKATPLELVTALRNDNLLWRMHAQRLLVQRGKTDVLPALRALIADGRRDQIGLTPGAIHALWTMKGLGALDGSDRMATASATGALMHPVASVRRAAVTVLPRTSSSVNDVLSAGLLNDADAQVRLATLLALSEMPASERAGAAVFATLQQPANVQDRWIREAATSAAAQHDAAFLRAALANLKSSGAESESTSERQNLLPNSSIENERDGQPLDWRPATDNGQADLALATTGYRGQRSLQIQSESGAEASWSVEVAVTPRTTYRLSGWIRTANLQAATDSAQGALLNVREISDRRRGATRAVLGTTDWTPVEMEFNSGDRNRVTVDCLFGGRGQAKGTAWFDDVQLVQAAGALLSSELGQVVQRVTGHYAQRGAVDTILPTLLALRGTSRDLGDAIIEGLAQGWPDGVTPALTEEDQTALVALMDSLPGSAKDRLLALAQRWSRENLFGSQIAGIIGPLRLQVANSTLPEAERVSAAERLLGLDDTLENIQLVLGQINLLSAPTLTTGLIRALAESRLADTGRAVLARWSQFSPAARRSAIFALTRRNEWANALLDAVAEGTLQRTDLAAEQWSQLRQNLDPAISNRARILMSAGAAVSDDRQEVIQRLLPLAKESGDLARGKEVFTANCANCHIFNGQGATIGPDLTGLGSRDRTEILMDILDPNRSVEANYRAWNVTTKGGETYSGRLDAETQTSVEILDAAGQKHIIQRDNMASFQGSPLSVMPSGFEALPPDDLKALLEYIGQRHD